MATRRQFYHGSMTFFFDKSFSQAIEFISKTFDKPSVIIFLHQSTIILVQRKTAKPVIKIINYMNEILCAITGFLSLFRQFQMFYSLISKFFSHVNPIKHHQCDAHARLRDFEMSTCLVMPECFHLHYVHFSISVNMALKQQWIYKIGYFERYDNSKRMTT